MRFRAWVMLFSVAIASSMAALMVSAGSADATLPCCGGAGTYTNYSAVVSYALQWVGTDLGTSDSAGWNAEYFPQSDDCTDFVSQALTAGGWANDTTANNGWEYIDTDPYPPSSDIWTPSWVNVQAFVTYAYNSHRGYFLNSGALYQNANWADVVPGDILMVNWDPQNGTSIDHAMIVTSTSGVGWGQVKLSDIKITQHTKNRKNWALTNDTGPTGLYPGAKWWIMEPY